MTKNKIGFDNEEREQNCIEKNQQFFDVIITTHTNKIVPGKLNLLSSSFTLEASILHENFAFTSIEAIFHCTFQSQIGLKFAKKRSLVLYSKTIFQIMEIFLQKLSNY